MEKVEKVEWHDVQGLVESGFANLQYAAYVLWHFGPGPVEARKTWIRGLADRLIRVDDLDTAVAPPHRPRSISRLKARIKEAMALTVSGLAPIMQRFDGNAVHASAPA
jgi:hypothetical protein